MALGQGQIFASGIAIVLKGTNDALSIPDGAKPLKFLHFVDAAGNTIAPELVPDGLSTPAGPLTGVKFTIPSVAQVQAVAAAVVTLQGDVASAIADAEAAAVAASAAQADVDAIEPYAVPGGRWITNPVVTANYGAVEGEYVRVDMTGKSAPDEVMITLPEADASNLGRTIKVAEISPGGVVDGALLKIQIATGQNFDSGLGSTITINNQPGARWTFVAVKHSVSPDVYGWSVEGYDP